MPLLERSDQPALYYEIDDYTDPWRDAPCILLQHGFGRSSTFWYRWIPYLSRFYRIVRPDLRGLGRSSKDFDLKTGVSIEAYLDDMDAALFMGVGPQERPATVLAALGPKMLRLSAERADGAHPYFVPVDHTAQAREILGPDAILAPEQMVVLDTDRGRALETARKGMAIYLRAPNYVNNLKRYGFTDDDFDKATAAEKSGTQPADQGDVQRN